MGKTVQPTKQKFSSYYSKLVAGGNRSHTNQNRVHRGKISQSFVNPSGRGLRLYRVFPSNIQFA